MRFRTRFGVLSLAVALAGATSTAAAPPQAAAPQAPPTRALAQQIPLDPAITTGRFANGLRYFIRTTKRPEKRAELRLVVDVGSIVEENDQQGLAHFLEHMAF